MKSNSFYSLTALWKEGTKNLSHKEQHNSFEAELCNMYTDVYICVCRSADTYTSNPKSAL